MANVRWNFRLGPLQFTSPAGVTSAAVLGGLLVLCCCGAGVVGAFNDGDDPPSRPTVNTTTLASTAPPSVPAQPLAPSPTRSTVVEVSPSPKRTTTAPRPSPTTRKPSPPAPKNDPQFDTCAKANAAGYGPYVEGEDPEYEWYRDRDGDGIVCERS